MLNENHRKMIQAGDKMQAAFRELMEAEEDGRREDMRAAEDKFNAAFREFEAAADGEISNS